MQNLGRRIVVGGVGLLLFFGLIMVGSIVENVDADEILVIQDRIDGDLHWYIDAGLKWQLFGKPTKYPKRDKYDFDGFSVTYTDDSDESATREGARNDTH